MACFNTQKIRGVLSEGMLCSGEELGFEKSEGLYILDADAPVGEVLGVYLRIDKDIILDIITNPLLTVLTCGGTLVWRENSLQFLIVSSVMAVS